jgi:excisionase family DNA binding protein
MKKIPFPTKPEPALRVSQAAEAINVTTRTIRSWIKDGTLPSFRIGGVVRIPSNAIQSLLEGAK